ncbi:hypothetical protein H8E88_25155 [candidate division KSB1 bacterium]|nr:hypothetical protein [candidate division KSB1 bacterium]
MNKLIPILTIIILSTNVFSQESYRLATEIRAGRLVQGNVIQSLCGIGASGSIINTLSNISSSNPASLFDYKKLSIGISKQFNTKIYPAWYVNIGYKQYNNYLPQSAGFILAKDNFRIGLGFSQRYNAILDYGEMEVTTIEQPEGTGEKFNATDKTIVYSYSFIMSHSLENFIIPKGILNIGFRFDIDRLFHNSSLWNIRMEAKDYSNSWSFGARYDIQINSFLNLKIGSFFEKGAKFETSGSYSGIEIIQPIDMPGNYKDVPVQPVLKWPVIANFPSKLHTGIALGFKNSFFVVFDLTKVYWKQFEENFQNNLNISGSLIYRPNKRITTSFGFLSLDKKDKDEIGWVNNMDGELKALFLTSGLIFHFNKVDIGISYANSKNSESGKWYKHSLSKLSLSFYF